MWEREGRGVRGSGISKADSDDRRFLPPPPYIPL